MNISVLRIGHRLVRDDRVTTHAALVARAFGADMIYMTGTSQTGLSMTQFQAYLRGGAVGSKSRSYRIGKVLQSLEKGRWQSGSPYNVWHQY